MSYQGVKVEQFRPYIVTALSTGTPVARIAGAIGIPITTVKDYIRRENLRDLVPDPGPAVLSDPEPTGPTREEMLEDEVKRLKASAAKQRKSDVAQERILQAIEQALVDVPPSPVKYDIVDRHYDLSSSDAHHRQVLLLSDFHGGEVVDPEVINGLNSYDWDTMLARVDQTIDAYLSHLRNSPAITGLDVLFLGDMCSGANHDEITVTNEYPLAEQAVKMGHLQAEILERLAPHVPDLRAGGVEGNHPRFTKAPAAKQPHNNGDWIANMIAAERVKHIGVPFTVGRGSMFWEIAGRWCYVWHGDGIRSSMPGVPWGGVMRRINEIQAHHVGRIDHFFYGHFHQSNVVQGGRIIGNGALKGPDEWTAKNFGGGSPPSQTILTFDEKRSRLTDVRYITPTAGL